jgi:hypothetical protein
MVLTLTGVSDCFVVSLLAMTGKKGYLNGYEKRSFEMRRE